MDKGLIISAGGAASAGYACTYLRERGFSVTNHRSPDAVHLLLDVPSCRDDGTLRFGGTVEELLLELPKTVTVWGGNLNHPALAGYKTVDFLRDPDYLAQNAYITAECVLDVMLPRFSGLLRGCPVLIIGWGRIGKCLAKLLHALEADVTVAARKESDRAILTALGYQAVNTAALPDSLPQYRVILNTAPAPVLSRAQTSLCSPDCLKIELASKPGIEGEDIITARGLPGIHRPQASGILIARTMIQYFHKEESS